MDDSLVDHDLHVQLLITSFGTIQSFWRKIVFWSFVDLILYRYNGSKAYRRYVGHWLIGLWVGLLVFANCVWEVRRLDHNLHVIRINLIEECFFAHVIY